MIIIYVSTLSIGETRHHNAKEMCDRARILRISINMGHSERRKTTALASVNMALLRILHPDETPVHVERTGETEMEDMWRFARQAEGLLVVGACQRSRHRSSLGIWLWPMETRGASSVAGTAGAF